MTYLRRGDGPENAKIMLVGEYYSEKDEAAGLPFQGYPGSLLNTMLHEAGIMRSECYTTNVVNARPSYNDITKWVPKKKGDVTKEMVMHQGRMVHPIVVEGHLNLLEEVKRINPHIIITFGNLPLFSLTGHTGALKWRGSQLRTASEHKLLPAIHPNVIMSDMSLHATTLNDLRRAARHRYEGPYKNEPDWRFIIRPSLQTVLDTYAMLEVQAVVEPIWVEFDIETSPVHITCFSISWSLQDAMCVPITSSSNADGYWSLEEEALVVHGAYKLLTNPNIYVRGQNLLYDCQHTYRYWHFIPNVKQDTMLSHHSMFCGMKKSLDFQASLYCDHYVYWKEMHKDLSNKAGA